MSGKAVRPQAGQGATAAAETQVQPQILHAQQQQQPAAPAPLRLPLPSGRPPLPRSVAASATSSRASSPRSGISAQSSLHTLSMSRQAQYQREFEHGPALHGCCRRTCLSCVVTTCGCSKWPTLAVPSLCKAPVLQLLHACSSQTRSRARACRLAMLLRCACKQV